MHLIGGITIVSKISTRLCFNYISACLCIYIYHVFCCAYKVMLNPLIIYNSSNSYGYSEFKCVSFS
jgi:hypothetical protein